MQVIPKSEQGLQFYQKLVELNGTVQMFNKTYRVQRIIGRAVTLIEVIK